MILPQELYALVQEKIVEKSFSYARVFMSLHDIITGDFFNQYIKAGACHHFTNTFHPLRQVSSPPPSPHIPSFFY